MTLHRGFLFLVFCLPHFMSCTITSGEGELLNPPKCALLNYGVYANEFGKPEIRATVINNGIGSTAYTIQLEYELKNENQVKASGTLSFGKLNYGESKTLTGTIKSYTDFSSLTVKITSQDTKLRWTDELGREYTLN